MVESSARTSASWRTDGEQGRHDVLAWVRACRGQVSVCTLGPIGAETETPTPTPVTFFVTPAQGVLVAGPGMAPFPCRSHDPGVLPPGLAARG